MRKRESGEGTGARQIVNFDSILDAVPGLLLISPGFFVVYSVRFFVMRNDEEKPDALLLAFLSAQVGSLITILSAFFAYLWFQRGGLSCEPHGFSDCVVQNIWWVGGLYAMVTITVGIALFLTARRRVARIRTANAAEETAERLKAEAAQEAEFARRAEAVRRRFHHDRTAILEMRDHRLLEGRLRIDVDENGEVPVIAVVGPTLLSGRLEDGHDSRRRTRLWGEMLVLASDVQSIIPTQVELTPAASPEV